MVLQVTGALVHMDEIKDEFFYRYYDCFGAGKLVLPANLNSLMFILLILTH